MSQIESRVSVVASRIEILVGHLACVITGIVAHLERGDTPLQANATQLVDAAIHDCNVLSLEAHGLSQAAQEPENRREKHDGMGWDASG